MSRTRSGPADLRRRAEIDAAIEALRKRHGRIDILFANAGKGLAAPLDAVTKAQIDEQFGLNFKGLFFTVQKAARLMEKGGSIILTTSFLNAVGASGLSTFLRVQAAYPRRDAIEQELGITDAAAYEQALVVPLAWVADARLVRLSGWAEDELGVPDYTRVR